MRAAVVLALLCLASWANAQQDDAGQQSIICAGRLKQAHDELEVLTEELDAAIRARSLASEEAASLRKELSTTQDDLKTAQSQLQEVTGSEKLDQELQAAKKRAITAEAELAAAKVHLEAAEGDLAKALERFRASEAEQRQLLEEVQAAKTRAAAAEEDLRAAQLQLKEAAGSEKLEQELQAAKQRAITAEAQLAAATARLEASEGEAGKALERLKVAESELKQLLEEVQEERRQKEALKRKLESAGDVEADLREEVVMLGKRLSDAKAKLASLAGVEERLVEAGMAQQEAQAQVASLQGEVSQLALRLQETSSQAQGMAELQAQVHALNAARQEAAAAQAAAEQRAAAVQATLDKLVAALALREQYDYLRERHVTELMPYWLEVRYNNTKAAAHAAAVAVHDAAVSAATAAATFLHGVWTRHVEPALSAGWHSASVTANRAAAQLKAVWLLRCVPLLRQAEGALERRLGEGWPRFKGAVAAGSQAAQDAAQRGWARAAAAAHGMQLGFEDLVLQQMRRVPALAPYAQRPLVTYAFFSLLAALTAPLVLALAARSLAAQRASSSGPRRFVARADTAHRSPTKGDKPAAPLQDGQGDKGSLAA